MIVNVTLNMNYVFKLCYELFQNIIIIIIAIYYYYNYYYYY